MAHNLARWAARIGLGEQVVTTKTLPPAAVLLPGRAPHPASSGTLAALGGEVHRALALLQRQWSERAIARTTPALFGLFSVVTLAADILIGQRGGMAPRTAAWYDKTSPSFADAIALVRRHLWVQQGTFMPSEREHESIKVPRLLYHRMLDTLAYAA